MTIETIRQSKVFWKVLHPAQKILETAKKESVDVVVMATHGRKGHFAFGSVTEKVVKNAPVPVWTVRPIEIKT